LEALSAEVTKGCGDEDMEANGRTAGGNHDRNHFDYGYLGALFRQFVGVGMIANGSENARF